MAQKYAVVKNGSNLQEIQLGDRLNGESTGIYSDTVALSSADIATLNAGVDIVPAQGAGTILMPTFASMQFTHGDQSFTTDSEVYLLIGSLQIGTTQTSMAFSGTDDIICKLSMASINTLLSNLDNQQLSLTSDMPIDPTGAILTSSIDSAGSGYAPGDYIVLSTIPLDNQVIVDTVDGSGAVLTYTVSDPGTGIAVEYYSQDSTSGIGTGFTLLVDSITPLSNGTASLYIEYKIIPVAA